MEAQIEYGLQALERITAGATQAWHPINRRCVV
jgi:hypothetical protein